MISQVANTIFGTTIFGPREAMRGYALNRMCFSFNHARNREAFLRDEEAYCNVFGLTEEQRRAVRERNVLALVAGGGNIYYLGKLAGCLWARRIGGPDHTHR